MAYFGRNQYGWNPSNWYEGAEEHRRFEGSEHHHPKGKKGHVAFKTESEEVAAPQGINEGAEEHRRFEGSEQHHPKGKKGHVAFKTESEEVAAPQGINQTALQGVDDEADVFIENQHKRIELSKLMSMRAAGASV